MQRIAYGLRIYGMRHLTALVTSRNLVCSLPVGRLQRGVGLLLRNVGIYFLVFSLMAFSFYRSKFDLLP